MIKVKIEVTYNPSGTRSNKLSIGNNAFDMSALQLIALKNLLSTYIDIDYVTDKVLESSI